MNGNEQEIKAIPRNYSSGEKKLTIALIVISCFLLISLGVTGYLYFTLPKPEKEIPSSYEKPIPTKREVTKTPLKKEETPTPIQKENLRFYENTDLGFEVSYPLNWGEVVLKTDQSRTTLKLGESSGLMIIVGLKQDEDGNEIVSLEKLREIATKSGCSSAKITKDGFQALRISCDRETIFFEQAYVFKPETYYSLSYRYHLGPEMETEEAKKIFDFIFDSFKFQ